MPADRRAFSYRDDPTVPAFPDDHPVIVFDGHCVMCSASAQFVMKRDGAEIYKLAAAQTPLGQALYRHYGLDPDDYETMMLIADGHVVVKSDAAIQIAEGLGLPWSLARVFRIVPRALRDRLYELIARNRYRLFERRETCFAPTPEMKRRFLT